MKRAIASATVLPCGKPRAPARISASRFVAHACAWAFVGKVEDSSIPSGRRMIRARHESPRFWKVATVGYAVGYRQAQIVAKNGL